MIANAVNLHPDQVILGIIIFGRLFATLGAVLAIPVIATAKTTFNNLYDISNKSQLQSL